jgi:tetratricopeptide (TPR) repeat protein
MNARLRTQRLREIERAVSQGMTSTIIELSRAFLKDYPNWVAVQFYCAGALADRSEYVEAKRLYNAAIRYLRKHDPEYLNLPFSGLGHLYVRKGDHPKAAAWFAKASEVEPNNATYLIYQGVAAYQSGDAESARSILQRATKCPDGALEEAYYNLGVVFASLNEYDRSLDCFRKALELDPKYKIARKAMTDIIQVKKVLDG